jgi:outer membrane protein OmpA-like peptidoglycan-associated protein
MNCKSWAQYDTCKVYFKLDVDIPDKRAIHIIDSLVYNDAINSASQLLIVGYADFLGSEVHNKGLSERRSKSIETYLLNMGIPQANIKLCIGKGEIDRALKLPEGYSSDRRVDIVIQHYMSKFKKLKSIIKNDTPAATPLVTAMAETKIGQAFRLENIFFYVNRHIITEESYPQLNKLVDFLESNPNVKIQIEGHICCLKYHFDAEDEDTRERHLSLNRAKYIYDYLAQKGVEKERMRYIGFGNSMPLISPERTPKDEEMNRRVEIRILEK